jgi:NAD(P) transhydrogenase
MVGKTEEELTAECVPYEVGVAHFDEIARGQIIGDHVGLLKLLFHRETLQLLGVHCIGETATEIIHIGQAVMSFGGTIDYFTGTVFNYPTMAECYKVAAFDGRNRACIDELLNEPDERPHAIEHRVELLVDELSDSLLESADEGVLALH